MPSLMDKIDEMEKENWRLDPEKSFARLTITPVGEGDNTYYDIDEVIEIRPYPNPFGFGGMYTMGGLKSEAEVKKQIGWFKDWLKVWQERGLTNVEIIRRPQVTRAALRNLKRQEMLEDKATKGEKPHHKDAQLSLI